MLHLQSGVHFEEVELTVLVEEFDRTGIDVPARPGHLDRCFAHRLANVVGKVGRRALLDEFLVAPLGGAVALPQPHGVPVGVGDDLHLHVAGPRQVPLHVALVPTEVGEGLPHGRLQSFGGLLGTGDHLHAPPAAAVSRFDGHRPSELVPEGGDLLWRGQDLGSPGHAGYAGPLGGVTGADLVAHHLDGTGWGTDEGDAAVGDRPGEVGVLREEPVPRVDAVGPALFDDAEDCLGVQIALRRRLASERVGLVGQSYVEGVTIEVGVDGDGGHTQLATGPDHPDRDLSPVGDEDLLEHAAAFRIG